MSYKLLTLANWNEPDPVNFMFVQISCVAGVGQRPMDGQHWARQSLNVELENNVPENVRESFDVTRGTMLYGWFVYPLFLLGEQQMYRSVL
jgi:hypothetical protein